MSLKLVRRPKSPNWIIRGTLRGIRINESTGVAGRRAAEEIRAERQSELKNGRSPHFAADPVLLGSVARE